MKKITAENRNPLKNNQKVELIANKALLLLISAGSNNSINTSGVTCELITQAFESISNSSQSIPGNGAGLRPPFN
jgi:hypothetical protein